MYFIDSFVGPSQTLEEQIVFYGGVYIVETDRKEFFLPDSIVYRSILHRLSVVT